MAQSSALTRKIIVSYLYVTTWIVLSGIVIVFNKYILDRRMFNWPFPISLTMIHMAFCSSIAYILVSILKVVEPVAMSREVYLTSVVPIGALYAMSLWLSNSAYIYLSVSFIQMLKALMPVAVYILGVAFRKDSFRCFTFSNMLLISFGVAIAAYGEANFNTTGVALQLGAVAFEATRLVLIQILLTSKGISLNPITSLYYVAPTCFVCLSVPWFFVERPLLQPRPLDFSLSTSTVLLSNCTAAFALNLAVFLLIGKTSALTMNVAGVVKDWLLIAFSWSVIMDKVTTVNLLGYLLAFLGVCWYNHTKLQDLKAREAAKKAAGREGDEEKGLLSDSNGGREGGAESRKDSPVERERDMMESSTPLSATSVSTISPLLSSRAVPK